MAGLVDALKSDHAVILATLNQIKEVGISSKEGRDKLLEVKNLLLHHLQKEDRELYPRLRRAAEVDISLRQTLELFAKDMDEISRLAMEFFQKYAQGGAGVEFARDFGRLYATLGERIRREENIIYVRFQQLEKK
ncbi:MAG: hemerythrin domain-containing protein [Bacillota bacterium]